MHGLGQYKLSLLKQVMIFNEHFRVECLFSFRIIVSDFEILSVVLFFCSRTGLIWDLMMLFSDKRH